MKAAISCSPSTVESLVISKDKTFSQVGVAVEKLVWNAFDGLCLMDSVDMLIDSRNSGIAKLQQGLF